MLILLLILCLSANIIFSQNVKEHGLDPEKMISQYVHKSWTPGKSFLQNSVHAITQAENGLLLVGTSNGLYKFDGVNFSYIELGLPKVLGSTIVFSLLRAHDNSIYVGTNKGLFRLIDFKPVPFNCEGFELSTKEIFSLAEGKDGTIWIGTNQYGIVKYSNNNKFEYYKPHKALANSVIYAMEVDSNNNLWVGTNGAGLFKLLGNKVEWYNEQNGLSSNVVRSIQIDGPKIIIGTNGKGLDILENNRIKNISKNLDISDGVIFSLLKDSKNTLWIGTAGNGLKRLVKGKLDSYTYLDGLPNDIVNTIFEDREGNIWIGLRGGFLSQLKNSFVSFYTVREGLSSNFVRSICEGKNGTIWIGTNGGGVNKLEKNKITILDSKNGLSNGIVRSVLEDKRGTLWVGTYGGGLNILSNGKFKVLDTKHGFLNDIVMSMIETKDGSIWVGTGNGIVVFDKNYKIVKTITEKNGLSHPYIRSMIERTNGDIWISTSRGIDVYSKGKIYSLKIPDTLTQKTVLSFHEDKSGVMWFGTYNEGLYRYSNGKFTRYKQEQGMLENVVYNIFEDSNGILWFTSNYGIFGINKEKLNNYAENKTTSLSENDYLLLNDFLGIECNGASQPSGCITKDGIIWASTMVGALLFDTKQVKTTDLPPKPIITGIVINSNWIDFTKPLKLDASVDKLEMHYTAINFYSADNILFKYKLEPIDKDWIYAGGRRVAYYTNLPPGNYTFKVVSSNGYHYWGKEELVFSFYKKPYFYQTFWFYVLMVIIVGLIVFITVKIKIREHSRREKELMRLVNEKTIELRESENRLRELNKNKDYFFSHISHDLKGVFMSLMGFSDVLVNDLKKLSIDDIYKFARNINDSIRYLFQLMNNLLDWSRVQIGKVDYKPQKVNLYESISKVIYIQKPNAEKKKINIVNDVNNNHFVLVDDNMFYSVMNNILNNAIKFSRIGSDIQISSSRKDNYYEIKVKDYGIGIESDNLDRLFKIDKVFSKSGTNGEGGTGLGLILCKDLISKNKGEIKIDSAPNKGTTVYILLPVTE
jgi:ligand-binding sensor domain-containing protein/signal transduction histidine kinase